jgi:K+-sensing histidine kinase KdpD
VSALGLSLVDEVSQDLRPPLTIVKGCLETVLSNWDALDVSQRSELLGAALKSADDLTASIELLEARLLAIERASGTSISSIVLDR